MMLMMLLAADDDNDDNDDADDSCCLSRFRHLPRAQSGKSDFNVRSFCICFHSGATAGPPPPPAQIFGKSAPVVKWGAPGKALVSRVRASSTWFQGEKL